MYNNNTLLLPGILDSNFGFPIISNSNHSLYYLHAFVIAEHGACTYEIALPQGFMWEIAEEFGALLVFAEHRYYGESMPYGSESFEDRARLGYLTSQQALADYVDLITYLRHNGSYAAKQHRQLYGAGNIYDDTRALTDAVGDVNATDSIDSNPVIAFGGSYGGMLAAWFRIKYPAIVEG